MLHKNVQMVDIDVDHWRNLQDLFLESAKEKRRVIVIHEDGEIQKFVHSDRIPIERPIERVVSSQDAAKAVYGANRMETDFVMVLERRAVEQYMTEIQNSWSPDEDIDEYVNRMYSLLPKYADGIATYPGPAEMNLGIQWRIGATYEELRSLIGTYTKPDTTAILGLLEGEELWATLVLAFDSDRRIELITSAQVPVGTRFDSLDQAAATLAGKTPGNCSLGLFARLEPFRSWLRSEDKAAAWARLTKSGDAVLNPTPQQLKDA